MQMNRVKLRRYTSLPILLDMLINRKMTLLDPFTWEDRNDSFFMEKYRERKKLKTVLALCFTTKPEQFHHWKVFAGTSSGVCIRFKANKLLTCFDQKPGIRSGAVEYRLIKELKNDLPSVDELPFIKRRQYEDEAEFRILYESRKSTLQKKDFPISLESIDRITLSPWLPYSVSETIKGVIREIPGCSSIQLLRTGVVENLQWKKIADKLKLH